MPLMKAARTKSKQMDEVNTSASSTPNTGAASCCTPRCCFYPEDLIYADNPGSAVKVYCNNDECDRSNWMHKSCFEEWEATVLTFLRTCGRARSWSEKQRLQNLWTKKGYDLAFKACDCVCGKGHLRKDLDYIPPKVTEEETKKQKPHRRVDKVLPIISTRSQVIPNSRLHVQIRPRTTSISSTGSSPPQSSSPSDSPTEPSHLGTTRGKAFEFSLTMEQAAAGNIFHHRDNLQAFNKLPPHKRNAYHIKMEDEGPYGNDETRCFVLSSLSSKRITCIPCVVCGHELSVFDRYPLIDGTLFLTPQRYISDISVQMHGQTQYMNAVCMMCAEGFTELRCKACHRRWDGSALQIGTMYSYDVFAGAPCCTRRLTCKSCQKLVIEPGYNLPFFSQYSHPHTCRHCKSSAYHFVKPLSEIFYINRH